MRQAQLTEVAPALLVQSAKLGITAIRLVSVVAALAKTITIAHRARVLVQAYAQRVMHVRLLVTGALLLLVRQANPIKAIPVCHVLTVQLVFLVIKSDLILAQLANLELTVHRGPAAAPSTAQPAIIV